MNKKNIDFVLIVAIAAIIALVVFSKSIGADFAASSNAVVKSLLFIGVAAAAWAVLKFRTGWVLIAPLPFIWPNWWPVLISIANDGKSPSSQEVINIIESPWYSAPWYVTSYCNWGVEVVLVVLWVVYWKFDD